MSNIGQFHDEAEEAKDIILKKKESYRVEIRRRKLDETLSISRQRAYSPVEKQVAVNINDNENEEHFAQQLIDNLRISVAQLIQNPSLENQEKLMNIILSASNFIGEESIKSRAEALIKGNIFELLFPIITTEALSQFTFLIKKTHYLYGSLFYMDPQFFMPFLNDKIIQAIVNSLYSNEVDIINLGIYAIGNLISGSVEAKQAVYDLEVVDSLFQIHKTDKLNVDEYGPIFWENINEMIWILQILLERKCSNFVRRISFSDQKKILEIYIDLVVKLSESKQADIKMGRLLTLGLKDVIGSTDELITCFFKQQSLKNVNLASWFLAVMQNCELYDKRMVQYISRTIFNIASGPDEYCEGLLHNNLLSILQSMYNSEIFKKELPFKEEILWCLSNITAVNSHTITLIMDHEFFGQLMDGFQNSQQSTKREILYILINIFKTGNSCQKRIIVNNYIEIYLSSLNTQGIKLIISLLEGLDALLRSFSGIFTANGDNVLLEDLEKYNFSSYLNALQNHKNDHIYSLVANIITKHFNYS